MNRATNDIDKRVRAGAEGVADTASEYASRAYQAAQGAVDGVSEHAGEAQARLQDAASTVRTAVDRSLKTQPLTTLAVAAIAGFVVGALWKS